MRPELLTQPTQGPVIDASPEPNRRYDVRDVLYLGEETIIDEETDEERVVRMYQLFWLRGPDDPPDDKIGSVLYRREGITKERNHLCPKCVFEQKVWEVEEVVALEKISSDKLRRARVVREQAWRTGSNILGFSGTVMLWERGPGERL